MTVFSICVYDTMYVYESVIYYYLPQVLEKLCDELWFIMWLSLPCVFLMVVSVYYKDYK